MAEKDIQDRRDYDKRVRALFNTLDTAHKGCLRNTQDLRHGLLRIRHPSAHSDALLNDIFKQMDYSKNGYIDFRDFERFAKKAEGRLSVLYSQLNIDSGHHRLERGEIKQALNNAGITVGRQTLNVDEFVNFLLFAPEVNSIQKLFSFFTTASHDSSEGDVLVSPDIMNGLGYFACGALAGAVSRTSTAPFDRLKTYLITYTNSASATVSLKQAVQSIWNSGGFRAFFSGNLLNVIKIAPESAIKFGSFEACKETFARVEGTDKQAISPYANFLAGGIAGAISQFAIYPLDTLRFRVQCEPRQSHSNLVTAKKMWQAGGYRTYYKGLALGLVGIFPYSAFDLGSFELLRQSYIKAKARSLKCQASEVELSNFTVLCFGALSGSIGATIVYPLNSARVRLQAQGSTLHPRTYSGIMDVVSSTLQKDGPRGLYRGTQSWGGLANTFSGLLPNLFKVAPAVSISYLVYIRSKELLDLH